jgi:CelD/BcsL family acetyltransferase involved in cellulose biosynthesis
MAEETLQPTPAGSLAATAAPSGSGGNVKLVSSEAEFAALRSQWNSVAASCVGATPFLTHEWFDAAWQWRRQTARLNLLCFFAGQRLAAILPLVLQESRLRGVRVRELGFLTVPDTQTCDVIVAEPDRAAAVSAFAAELALGGADWDVMRLKYLPRASVAAAMLRPALARCGFASRTAVAPGNPFIALDSTWEAYYATRSRRLKKANNLAANRLQKGGEIRIDWLAPDGGSAFETFVDRAIAVSGRSWKTRTANSLDNPGPQRFIRRLSASAGLCGWLSIWILSVNDRPVAMEYQLLKGGNVYALRSDFDAEFEPMSPGTHLSRYLLSQLFGRGLSRYYMGPGGNAYKLRWTDQVEPVDELTIYGRTLAGRCLGAWEIRVRPTAIRLRDRLGAASWSRGQ